jgi:acyl carrier protein
MESEIFKRVRKVLAKTQLVPEEEISLDSQLDKQLGMDSLDMAEFSLELGDEFGIALELRDIQPRTVRRVVELLADELLKA